MNIYLKLCGTLFTGVMLVGCAGTLLIDLRYDLEVRALSAAPAREATALTVIDEPRPVKVLNPFPDKRIDHDNVRMKIHVNSIVFQWVVQNDSTETLHLGFNDMHCLDANNQERLKLDIRSFTVGDLGVKKSRIFVHGEQSVAQNIEVSAGITTYISMVPRRMLAMLHECVNLRLDSKMNMDNSDLTGKEMLISIPYERAGSSGKYALRFKIVDTNSRTSYH